MSLPPATQWAAVSTASGATTTPEQTPPREFRTMIAPSRAGPASSRPPTIAAAGAAQSHAAASAARQIFPCGDIRMDAIALAGPAVEPVGLAEMKAYLRLDAADEDALVETLVAAARVTVERTTRLGLIEQSWRVRLAAWPAGRRLALPVAPVIGVTAVRVRSAAETEAVVPPSSYWLEGAADAPVLVVDRGVAGPDAPPGGIEIDLRVGFGTSGASVPEPLRLAIRRLVAQWFEHRGDAADASPAGLSADVRVLLAPFVRPRLA